MSDLKLIKEKIYKENRIEEILEKLGCEYIKHEQGGKLITARLPDGRNKRALQVRNNESLTVHIRNRGIKTDIYGLVSYILNECRNQSQMSEDLPYAKDWLIDQIDFDIGFYKPKKRIEYNTWLKPFKNRRKKSIVTENKVLSESIKNNFIMIPYYYWILEGISAETQIEFETGIDLQTKRVVNMVRNKKGELIGVKGRAMLKEDEEYCKYLYIYNCNKSIELYNLYRALPFIRESRKVLVFEGYKSCMKAHQFGFKNCVSIEGDSISETQARLLKNLGLDIQIVLCYDKDKSVDDIIEQAKKITNRKINAIYDVDNLLEPKMSPVDKGEKVWLELLTASDDYIIQTNNLVK